MQMCPAGRLGVTSFLEGCPLPERPLPPPRQYCLTLPAHSPVHSDWPFVPAEQLPGPLGALPAEPHHVAGLDGRPQQGQLPVPPAKEPDAAIGKNCFTI